MRITSERVWERLAVLFLFLLVFLVLILQEGQLPGVPARSKHRPRVLYCAITRGIFVAGVSVPTSWSAVQARPALCETLKFLA